MRLVRREIEYKRDSKETCEVVFKNSLNDLMHYNNLDSSYLVTEVNENSSAINFDSEVVVTKRKSKRKINKAQPYTPTGIVTKKGITSFSFKK